MTPRSYAAVWAGYAGAAMLGLLMRLGREADHYTIKVPVRAGRDWIEEVCRWLEIPARSRRTPRKLLAQAFEQGLVRVYDEAVLVSLIPLHLRPRIDSQIDSSARNHSTPKTTDLREELRREAERAREEVVPKVETGRTPPPCPPALDPTPPPVQLADASGETRLRAGFRRRLRERLQRGLTAHECRTLGTMAALVGPRLDALAARLGQPTQTLADELLERFFACPRATAARWRPGWISWRPDEYLPALKASTAAPPVAVWQPPVWEPPSEGPPADFAATLAALRRKAIG